MELFWNIQHLGIYTPSDDVSELICRSNGLFPWRLNQLALRHLILKRQRSKLVFCIPGKVTIPDVSSFQVVTRF